MTWRELGEIIADMDVRFLDTNVQLYDVEDGITYYEGIELLMDCTEDDFTIDVNQPQILFRMNEDESE